MHSKYIYALLVVIQKISIMFISRIPFNRKWKNKTFEECVMDASDPECHIKDGSVRDLYIVSESAALNSLYKAACQCWLLYLHTTYFSPTFVVKIWSAPSIILAGHYFEQWRV